MPEAAAPVEPIILVAVGGATGGVVRLPDLPDGSVVLAADSGLRSLLAAGAPVHHVVGDLDSAEAADVAAARTEGAIVHRHAPDKDATDLELALDLVVSQVARPGLERLVVIGPGGGRLDHLLADLALLAAPRLAHLDVAAHLDGATVQVVRPGRPTVLAAGVGAVVSLLPVHGAADGVTTQGLRWPLVDAHLAAGTSRAMSNEVVAPGASVEISGGVVVAIEPGTTAPLIPPRTAPYDPTPRRVDADPKEEQP